jgi:hypothetical protein
MSKMQARSGLRKQTIYATVKRADGAVQNFGLISAYHANPIIHYWLQLRIKLGEFSRWLRS